VWQQGGELEQAVETTASMEFCRGCAVQARLHDRRPTYVRDLPAAGRPVTLVWVKRVWRCIEPRCSVVTWSETSPDGREIEFHELGMLALTGLLAACLGQLASRRS
jgi:hypothetical protein